MKFLIPATYLSIVLMASAATPVEKPATAPAATNAAPEVPHSSKSGEVTIDGKKIPYSVTVSKILLKKDDGTARASIGYTSYTRSDASSSNPRPVLFAFNGGPGSSSAWLHIGALGPKTITLPNNGTTAPTPPIRVQNNPYSILDQCDLVFIDPVATGFSRAEKDTKPAEFFGLNEDISSCGEFIQKWVTEQKRWASPKYLIGESYGGIRVAGLSHHLHTRYGMNLNGIILMSTLLDFSTLYTSPGNDLGYLSFLPTYTSVAHFHKKIQGDRNALVQQAEAFTYGAYASSLLKGHTIPTAEKESIAKQLESLTSIPASTWLRYNLRIDPSIFRAELLKSEKQVIGRFDARVAWNTYQNTSEQADYDPSFSLAYGAFASALMDYLTRDLNYLEENKEDKTYEILTSVSPWNWSASNSLVNLSQKLSDALQDNPNLRVLVMKGYTDLATPMAGIQYSMNHLPNHSSDTSQRIVTKSYEGGHMFYLNPPDLIQCRKDMIEFIQSNP